jgi:molecular chaperone GrpE (heat shock protein)
MAEPAAPPPPAISATPPPAAPAQGARVTAKDDRRMSSKSKRNNVNNETVLARARRLARSEMRQVAQELGMEKWDPVEFKKIATQLRKSQEAAQTDNQRAAQQLKELQDQNAELRAQLKTQSAEVAQLKKAQAQWDSQRERMEAEYEIRTAAMQVGITDTDYAMELLKRHLVALPDDQPAPDPKDWFEGLKQDTTKRFLFREESVAAGPQPIASQQKPAGAQPAQQPAAPAGAQPSNIPPQGSPAAAQPGGAQPEAPNALDMKKRDFNAYSREKYGFSPGMA